VPPAGAEGTQRQTPFLGVYFDIIEATCPDVMLCAEKDLIASGID
jgi:hypothetical protein